jgi:hypothetical protein
MVQEHCGTPPAVHTCSTAPAVRHTVHHLHASWQLGRNNPTRDGTVNSGPRKKQPQLGPVTPHSFGVAAADRHPTNSRQWMMQHPGAMQKHAVTAHGRAQNCCQVGPFGLGTDGQEAGTCPPTHTHTLQGLLLHQRAVHVCICILQLLNLRLQLLNLRLHGSAHTFDCWQHAIIAARILVSKLLASKPCNFWQFEGHTPGCTADQAQTAATHTTSEWHCMASTNGRP